MLPQFKIKLYYQQNENTPEFLITNRSFAFCVAFVISRHLWNTMQSWTQISVCFTRLLCIWTRYRLWKLNAGRFMDITALLIINGLYTATTQRNATHQTRRLYGVYQTAREELPGSTVIVDTLPPASVCYTVHNSKHHVPNRRRSRRFLRKLLYPRSKTRFKEKRQPLDRKVKIWIYFWCVFFFLFIWIILLLGVADGVDTATTITTNTIIIAVMCAIL
jgi:hypothetical protein